MLFYQMKTTLEVENLPKTKYIHTTGYLESGIISKAVTFFALTPLLRLVTNMQGHFTIT